MPRPSVGEGGAKDLAVSNDGRRLFVTGTSYLTSATLWDYATFAYDTSSGSAVWTARFDGPANGVDVASSVAVGPDGSHVYVAGTAAALGDRENDFATVAYHAATGSELWNATFGGAGDQSATRVSVDPDRGRLFVSGRNFRSGRPTTIALCSLTLSSSSIPCLRERYGV